MAKKPCRVCLTMKAGNQPEYSGPKTVLTGLPRWGC
jgi:hypothetical protein